MGRYWSEAQLDRATPPQVADARGRAVIRTLDGIIGDLPLTAFSVRDPDTCPAAALPALIAEYSVEEFIDPNLPEAVQRRILKNAWHLQSLEGYDAGVQLGLGLLGMTAEITQWWQATPRRAPHTHQITVFVDEQLYPDRGGYLGAPQIAAAHKMIAATKRHSQETDLRIGVAVRPVCYGAAFSVNQITATAHPNVRVPPVLAAAGKVGVRTSTQIISKTGG